MKNVTDEAILSSQPDGTDDYTIDVDATLDRLRGGWLIPRGRCAHADGHCYSVFYTAHCLKVYIESPSADRDRVETYERIQDMHDKVPKDVIQAICNNVFSEYARRTVVLAKSDLIDKLEVVLFPSIPLRTPLVRSFDHTFRLLSEPCCAAARDPRPSPSTRRSAALCQATQTDLGGSVPVGLAERSLERLAIQRLYPQSLDRHRLAPARLSPVLVLEGPTRQAGATGRAPGSTPVDSHHES